MTATVCWQHLIKTAHAGAGTDRELSQLSRSGRSQVALLDFSEAQTFIEKYEWLGNVGAASLGFGLFLENHLAAVVCFAPPTAPTGFTKLCPSVPRRKIWQLCRGASAHWAPKHAASMLISAALRQLRRDRGIRLVIAYADPQAGEIGTVYQAANAIYLGLTDARGPGHYVINGQRMHPRAVHRAYGSARHEVLAKIDSSYERHQRNRKHRYLFLLDSGRARRRVLDQVSHMSKPYPKRHERL
jgi:hypothetical protein